MKIDNFNYGINNYNLKKNISQPSFSSIHPSRYFIRCEDGKFRQVTNNDTIKSLQRKIVGWLNKSLHDNKRLLEGRMAKVAKKESESAKSMRERLMRFFLNNDRDFSARRVVKSVYIDSTGGKVSSYILTGNTVDLAGDGKSIGKVHSKIKESRDFARTYYGVSEETASKYTSAADARRLSQARADYHRQSEECVKKLMADEKVDRSTINLYFQPVINGKKKKGLPEFELVNAVLQKYMIQR